MVPESGGHGPAVGLATSMEVNTQLAPGTKDRASICSWFLHWHVQHSNTVNVGVTGLVLSDH